MELAPDFEGVAGIHGDRQKPARAWRRFADLGRGGRPGTARGDRRAGDRPRRPRRALTGGSPRQDLPPSRPGQLRRPVGALALGLRFLGQSFGLRLGLARGVHRDRRLVLQPSARRRALSAARSAVVARCSAARASRERSRRTSAGSSSAGCRRRPRRRLPAGPRSPRSRRTRRRRGLAFEDTGLQEGPELVVDRRGIQRRRDRITMRRASRPDRRDARIGERARPGPGGRRSRGGGPRRHRPTALSAVRAGAPARRSAAPPRPRVDRAPPR